MTHTPTKIAADLAAARDRLVAATSPEETTAAHREVKRLRDLMNVTARATELPPLAMLNALTCSKNVLMLLRVLNTSDLGWFYDCLKDSAVVNICEVCTSILDAEVDEGSSDLTPAEIEECGEYLAAMMYAK